MNNPIPASQVDGPAGRAPKSILVISYSQSGQLDRIVAALLAPLRAQVLVIEEKLVPSKPFPFPWSIHQFLDAFPEAFAGIPCPLDQLKTTPVNRRYDLIIIAYQVWYLAPSIPISSYLQSQEARSLLQSAPVLTIVGCRNMWCRAHAIVKGHLQAAGARLIGHIVLADRAYNLVSVITIVYWMLTGRKDRLLHLFPAPGISEDDISKCSAYGRIVADALSSSAVANIQEQLNRSLARQVVPHLLFQEKSAAKAFAIWSRVIRSRGGPGDPRRKPAVLMFGCWLASVLVLFTPLSFLIFYLALPFRRSAVDRQIRQVYTQ
jgi:hypothetical protein